MPPRLARRSSSNASLRHRRRNHRPRPSLAARSTSISRSVRTSGGGSTARRRRSTRPSRLVVVRPLGPLRTRQHDVGDRGGLGQEEVGHDQQVERAQPFLNTVRVRRGHDDVRADDQERADTVLATEGLEQFERRLARTGDRRLGDVPHRGEVAPRQRIVNLAIAGELVGLLAALASALSVALTGDRPVTAEAPADLTKGQCEVEIRERVVDALRLLLRAAAGQHHDVLRGAERAGGLDQRCFGHRR